MKQTTLKHLGIQSIVCMLLVLIGSVGGALCLQTGSGTDRIELELFDCHTVPAICFTSGNMKTNEKADTGSDCCSECLDLTFEELIQNRPHGRNADLIALPAVSHLQPLMNNLFSVHPPPPFSFSPDLVPKAVLSPHKSLLTTVLLI